jgi:hypothetical protein
MMAALKAQAINRLFRKGGGRFKSGYNSRIKNDIFLGHSARDVQVLKSFFSS